MPHSTKDFLKLQAEWDRKLAESGFIDAEQRDGKLKTWHKNDMLERDPVDIQSRTLYYQAAGRFLHDYTFPTDLERQIWAAHIEGLTVRAIVEVLVPKRLKRARVDQIIQKLVKIMVESWKK